MNKNIKVIPFPDIPDAYIVISGVKSNTANGCAKRMSFFYGTVDGGCEWEPDNGPLTTIYPVQKNDPEAREHWFYDYYAGNGYYSQCAVDDTEIAKSFIDGDYNRVFSILKDRSPFVLEQQNDRM